MMADWIKIQSYKHDGSLHRCWERNFLLEETPDFYITASTKTRVIEHDGRRWFSKEPAVAFFSKNGWYNAIAMIKDGGTIFYVNLASPTISSGGMLRYIDYDVDFKLFPDGQILTLDENEHERHKQRYHYEDDLLQVLEITSAKIINMLKTRQFPFIFEIIDDYYNRFLKLTGGR